MQRNSAGVHHAGARGHYAAGSHGQHPLAQRVGYPLAALLALTVALVRYNWLALVKSSARAVHVDADVSDSPHFSQRGLKRAAWYGISCFTTNDFRHRTQSSPMQTECNGPTFEFQPWAGRQVTARFEGGTVTFDAGALLLGEVARSWRWCLSASAFGCTFCRRTARITIASSGPGKISKTTSPATIAAGRRASC